MKTITTILLTLCMFGSLYGQEWLPESEQQKAKYNVICDTNTIPLDIEEQIFRHALLSVQPLLRLWDKYKKECYKDSSISTIEVYSANKNNTFEISRIDTIWIHKTKPTPQGFIEWLKKQ